MKRSAYLAAELPRQGRSRVAEVVDSQPEVGSLPEVAGILAGMLGTLLAVAPC